MTPTAAIQMLQPVAATAAASRGRPADTDEGGATFASALDQVQTPTATSSGSGLSASEAAEPLHERRPGSEPSDEQPQPDALALLLACTQITASMQEQFPVQQASLTVSLLTAKQSQPAAAAGADPLLPLKVAKAGPAATGSIGATPDLAAVQGSIGPREPAAAQTKAAVLLTGGDAAGSTSPGRPVGPAGNDRPSAPAGDVPTAINSAFHPTTAAAAAVLAQPPSTPAPQTGSAPAHPTQLRPESELLKPGPGPVDTGKGVRPPAAQAADSSAPGAATANAAPATGTQTEPVRMLAEVAGGAAKPALADSAAPAQSGVTAAGAAFAVPTPASTSPPSVAATHVAPPVGTSDWAPALSQQIVRLGPNRDFEMTLNPAELGPLKVRIAVADGHAQIVFVSEHAAVRQALESALPQLRTSFANSGISLGQATVGSGSGDPRAQQGTGQEPGPHQQRAFQGLDGERHEQAPARSGAVDPRSDRALDTFA